MKRVILGTAGHIDHGKTALVRALTGIDTDRLAEEKRRGITIELGFAHLTLPDGTVAGVVDVPGHERFVRAMAAGAGGVDIVVLVIAADEGVMPQTREHLDICRLLGVPLGLVAVTKSDLLLGLGEDWLPLLLEEIRGATAGTFLEGAPVIPVSAATGDGLLRLKTEIARLVTQVPERPADGPLLMPVDRAFSLKGFGTVVTGTLISGSVAPEDEIGLIPAPSGSSPLRVRTVQVHSRPVERALAGQRTAVNLPGVEVQAVKRGQALTTPGVLPSSSLLDVELVHLKAATRPLRHRAKLLLHLGTAQVEAAVSLVEGTEIPPGGTALCQLRLFEPVAALPHQHFILRGFASLEGRGRTVAGGRVLGIAAPRRRRGRPASRTQLEALATGDLDARLLAVLEAGGPAGFTETALGGRTAAPPRAVQGSLERLGARGAALLFDRDRRAWASGSVVTELVRRMEAALNAFHLAHPLEPGMGREALRGKLPPVVDPRLFLRVLSLAGEKGKLEVDGDVVKRRGHVAASAGAGHAVREKVASVLEKAGLTPPWLSELPESTGASLADVQSVLRLLVTQGKVVRVSAELYCDAIAVSNLKDRLVAFLREKKGISTQEFKELVGATRKHVIPLAEYFDREKVTLRVGEKRVLRGEKP